MRVRHLLDTTSLEFGSENWNILMYSCRAFAHFLEDFMALFEFCREVTFLFPAKVCVLATNESI